MASPNQLRIEWMKIDYEDRFDKKMLLRRNCLNLSARQHRNIPFDGEWRHIKKPPKK